MHAENSTERERECKDGSVDHVPRTFHGGLRMADPDDGGGGTGQ